MIVSTEMASLLTEAAGVPLALAVTKPQYAFTLYSSTSYATLRNWLETAFCSLPLLFHCNMCALRFNMNCVFRYRVFFSSSLVPP